MVYTIMRDPDKDTSRREFVETVDDLTTANDMVKHIRDHSPPGDYTFQQWGGRPYNVTHEFDRSRWVEKQHDWGDAAPTPGKAITL